MLFDRPGWNFCHGAAYCCHRKLLAAITSGQIEVSHIFDFLHGEHRKSFRMRPPRGSGDDLSGTFAPGRVLLDHILGIRVILGRASRPARLFVKKSQNQSFGREKKCVFLIFDGKLRTERISKFEPRGTENEVFTRQEKPETTYA